MRDELKVKELEALEVDVYKIGQVEFNKIYSKELQDYPVVEVSPPLFPRILKGNYKGYDYEITRTPLGTLNGYVKGVDVDLMCELDENEGLYFNGGITYTGKDCVGFDCNHSHDHDPSHSPCELTTYKTVEYVKRCIELSIDVYVEEIKE